MNLESIKFKEKGLLAIIYFDCFTNELLNKNIISEFKGLLEYLEDESSCKFIVIRNTGADSEANKYINIDIIRKWEILLRTIEKMQKITMAVIEDKCFGAGIQLALACDIRIAADNALFSHNEIELGILPGHSIFQLGKYCGLGRMMELIQTGKIYTAKDALNWGVIHEICDHSEIEKSITNLIDKYTGNSIDTHMLIRRLSKESFEMSYEDFLGCYLAAQYRVIDSLMKNQNKQPSTG